MLASAAHNFTVHNGVVHFYFFSKFSDVTTFSDTDTMFRKFNLVALRHRLYVPPTDTSSRNGVVHFYFFSKFSDLTTFSDTDTMFRKFNLVALRHRLYVPPTDTSSLCLAVDSTHTVVGLFRLLVRRSGTHCQMNSEIRRVMSTASNSSLKQSCSDLTSVTSALEVIFNVMRSINARFAYFTYLL